MSALSFRDPIYGKIEAGVAKLVGLPASLLAAIRTKGERSNADQVSEAGARTVYQITPDTRDAILKKHGVDAYAGPEQAAKAAAYVLKEGLDRNKGSVPAAVAEYHGGTDRKAWGPRTRAYVQRVTGQQPKGGDPNSGGGSTYDRVMAKRAAAQDTGPSIEKVYQAYRSGRMDPQDAAQFEHDVENGHIMLPRGGALKKQPATYVLPQGVIDAYNSHTMSDEDRAQVDADVRDGVVSLPRGVKLQAPPPRTAGEMFGMGMRGVNVGLSSLGDIVAGPVNALVNALPGEQGLSLTPFRDAETAHQDAMGAPRPESDTEKLANALNEAGAQGAMIGGPMGAARGALAPLITETVSSAAGGASSELARQSGAGPVGQFVAGLAGGGATAGGMVAAERGAALRSSRAARSAARTADEVAAAYPKEEVFDRTGNLTDEGKEVVTRHDIAPEELKAAYEAPPNVKAATANDAAVPREAVARTADEALPTQVVEEAPPVRAAPEAAPVRPVERAVEAPAAPAETFKTATDGLLPTTAKARMDEAASEGIQLTRGQATQDFATQDAEQSLRAAASGEGEKARTFLQEQAEAIKGAADRFRAAFDDPSTSAATRGQAVKDALRELRDEGRKGVNALYTAAAKVPGHDIPLDRTGILEAADEVIVDRPMDDASKKALETALAKFGLIGGEVQQKGRFANIVTDYGNKVIVRGDVQPLTLANAEEFRQALNAAWDSKGLMGRVVRALDDTVDEVLAKTATTERNDLFKQAREASAKQKQTFEAKDVVQNLIDWKKGTRTDAVLPENAIKKVFEGEATNLKKVKALLLSKPTEASRAAWKAIQAHGVATIFEKAAQRNANLGGGAIEAVSGAKLRTAIKAFGADKLRVLLDESEFNQLMKLQRIIGDATIPISGTTNPSGSAFKLMRFLGPIAGRLIPFGGQIADTVGGLVRQAKEVAQAQKTLKGVTEYTTEEAAMEVAKSPDTQVALAQKADEAARAFLDSFIKIAGSDRIVAPVLAAGSQASGGDE